MAVQTDIVHYVWTNWARGRDGKGSNEPLCAGKRSLDAQYETGMLFEHS